MNKFSTRITLGEGKPKDTGLSTGETQPHAQGGGKDENPMQHVRSPKGRARKTLT